MAWQLSLQPPSFSPMSLNKVISYTCNVNVKCIVEMLNDTYNMQKSEHICGLEKR